MSSFFNLKFSVTQRERGNHIIGLIFACFMKLTTILVNKLKKESIQYFNLPFLLNF